MPDELYRGNQRREFFRLKYPPDKCPRVFINGTPYGIVDISENGLKISNPFRHRMPDDICSLVVHFHEGEPIKVVGRLIRRETYMEAFYLIHGVPYKRILAEQNYINNLNK
jgi:hypothetical protein